VVFILLDEYNNHKIIHSPKSNLWHGWMKFLLSLDRPIDCESPPRPGRHTVLIDT